MKKIIFALLMMASVSLATTNEIIVQTYIKADKNSSEIERKPGNLQVQWTGNRYYTQVYTLTATNQTLSSGTLTSMGWAYFRNLSVVATNVGNNYNGTIHLSFANGASTNITMLAGETALMRLYQSCVVTTFQAACSAYQMDFEATFIEK